MVPNPKITLPELLLYVKPSMALNIYVNTANLAFVAWGADIHENGSCGGGARDVELNGTGGVQQAISISKSEKKATKERFEAVDI